MRLSSKEQYNLLILESQERCRVQDRQVRNGMISKIKEFLDDVQIAYNEICSLEDNLQELKENYLSIGFNKSKTLQQMQQDYINELNFLRDIGGDVSNYPKYLSKLRE